MVLVHGRPRPLRLPALREEQRRVIAWLATREGVKWCHQNFSNHAIECHDLIEIRDDCDKAEIADHRSTSSDWMFQLTKEQSGGPEWDDLTWTPDIPPEYAQG